MFVVVVVTAIPFAFQVQDSMISDLYARRVFVSLSRSCDLVPVVLDCMISRLTVTYRTRRRGASSGVGRMRTDKHVVLY